MDLAAFIFLGVFRWVDSVRWIWLGGSVLVDYVGCTVSG